MKVSALVIVVGLAALLSGCAVAPNTVVHQPSSVRPVPVPPPAAANGTIFQAAAYRPLFEDRRARLVGDTLTIAINERTSAGKSAASSSNKSGSAEAGVPTLFAVPQSTSTKLNLEAESAVKYEDKSSGTSSNNFSGTITVTVVEVLTNGNLLVSGEKQVALDKGAEFIRFSGVVNPTTITGANVVSSTQVADARIEYRTNSYIDRAQMMSMLSRFFLSVFPL